MKRATLDSSFEGRIVLEADRDRLFRHKTEAQFRGFGKDVKEGVLKARVAECPEQGSYKDLAEYSAAHPGRVFSAILIDFSEAPISFRDAIEGKGAGTIVKNVVRTAREDATLEQVEAWRTRASDPGILSDEEREIVGDRSFIVLNAAETLTVPRTQEQKEAFVMARLETDGKNTILSALVSRSSVEECKKAFAPQWDDFVNQTYEVMTR